MRGQQARSVYHNNIGITRTRVHGIGTIGTRLLWIKKMYYTEHYTLCVHNKARRSDKLALTAIAI